MLTPGTPRSDKNDDDDDDGESVGKFILISQQMQQGLV